MSWRVLLVFYNLRFRRVLLWVVGLYTLADYIWVSFVTPFTTRMEFPDFTGFFAAATAMRQGVDPYLPILSHGHYDFSPSYSYPPLTAWLLQPLVSLGHENAALLVLVFLQVCVISFVWITYLALRPVSRDEIVFGVILVLSFGPLFANTQNDQVNLVLLPLCALTLLAYRQGEKWWGGAAYGLSIAFKPLQPAPGLLLVWGRRGRMVVAAIVVGLAALAIAGVNWSTEYIFKVLPELSGGSGFAANAAPAGLLERLFHPESFYDGGAPGGLGVGVGYLMVVVAVVGLTWWRLGRMSRTTSLGRASEVAVAMAASPLILTIANTWHLVLLLIPTLILVRVAIAYRDGWVLAAAGIAFLLLGPVYSGFQHVLVDNFSSSVIDIANQPLMRVWNECQLVGMVILWAGCLRALGVNEGKVKLRAGANEK